MFTFLHPTHVTAPFSLEPTPDARRVGYVARQFDSRVQLPVYAPANFQWPTLDQLAVVAFESYFPPAILLMVGTGDSTDGCLHLLETMDREHPGFQAIHEHALHWSDTHALITWDAQDWRKYQSPNARSYPTETFKTLQKRPILCVRTMCEECGLDFQMLVEATLHFGFPSASEQLIPRGQNILACWNACLALYQERTLAV